MTFSVELPSEIERAAPGIPDLPKRLAAFVRHQIDLEAWRSGRGSAKACALVDEAFAKGDVMKADGLNREQAFAILEEVHGRITERP